MPHIRTDNQPVTQITVIEPEPGKQAEALNLMTERARFMARQPGFISVSLHRSADGSHIVNYIQWNGRDKLKAAHHAPEFRKKWPRFGELVENVAPCLPKRDARVKPGHDGVSNLQPRPLGLGLRLVAVDRALLDHGEPDVVEAVEQAMLAVGVDLELDHAAVGAADFLLLEIDRERGIGAAVGVVEEFLQVLR